MPDDQSDPSTNSEQNNANSWPEPAQNDQPSSSTTDSSTSDSYYDSEASSVHSIESEPATSYSAPQQDSKESLSQPDSSYNEEAVATISLPAPKKSKRKLIIGGIVALLLVVLFAGGTFALNSWYQAPEKVLSDAATNLIKAKAVVYDGNLLYKSKDGDQKIEIRFDGEADRANGSQNVEVKLTFEDKTYPLKASFMQTEDVTFYFRIDNLKQAIEESQEAGQSIPLAATKLLEKIDGRWVKITLDDIKEWAQEYADTQKCTGEVFRSVKNDDATFKQIADIYAANPFVTAKGEVESKDGNLGFDLDTNEARMQSFLTELNDAELLKKLQKCDDSYKLDPKDYTKEETPKGTTSNVRVYISQWSHELREVVSTYEDGENTGTATLKPRFVERVNISGPKDAMTLKELQDHIDELQKELLGGIQDRASASMNQSNANELLKKAEAYNAINSSYPTLAQLKAATDEAQLDASLSGIVSSEVPSESALSRVQYAPCNSNGKITGATIRYYDIASKAIKSLTAGSCTASSV